MKKILVTGFGPFDVHKFNPSEKVAQSLHGEKVNNYQIESMTLPVSYNLVATEIPKLLALHSPDIVISLGLAADRRYITPELVAINYFDSKTVDNEGVITQEKTLFPEGPDAYFSTLPVKELVNSFEEFNFEAKLSASAGLFVCNQTMYLFLHHIRKLGLETRSGFIHLPATVNTDDFTQALKSIIKKL